MVSTAGPRSRSASTRTPSWPPGIAWICSVRVSESGLYCSAMTLFTADVSGSMVTMPPLTRRGEIGDKVLTLFVPQKNQSAFHQLESFSFDSSITAVTFFFAAGKSSLMSSLPF